MANEPEEQQSAAQQSAGRGDAAGGEGTPPGEATLGNAEIESMVEAAKTASRQQETGGDAAGESSTGSAQKAAQGAPADYKDVEYLLNQAESALQSIAEPQSEDPPGLAPFQLQEFAGRQASTDEATLDLVRDVQLDVEIELGRTHMHLAEVLKLKKGAVVTLDKLAGDPVDIYVNGRLIARGEVLVLNDNFCVRVAELVVGEAALAQASK